MGNLDRLHAFSLRLHGAEVLIAAPLGPKRDHRGDALGHAVRFDDMQLLLGQPHDLLGGGDDVAVVGQQEDFVVRDRFDGREHVLRAGIHRLAAFDDRVHAQALEDLDQAAPRDHRDEADTVGACGTGARRGASGLEDAAVLRRHIADVELQQLAVAPREVDHAGRVVGVHVHLDELGLTDHEHRVAERFDLAADQLGVQVVALDQELRAVAPPALGQVERDLRRR